MHKHISISQGLNVEGCLAVKIDHNSKVNQHQPKQCNVDVVNTKQDFMKSWIGSLYSIQKRWTSAWGGGVYWLTAGNQHWFHVELINLLQKKRNQQCWKTLGGEEVSLDTAIVLYWGQVEVISRRYWELAVANNFSWMCGTRLRK